MNKLQKDVKNIRSSKNILVFADKSTNLYEVSREHYEKLLQDNITQTYKRANPDAKRKIDKESKQFAKHLGIDDRVECYSDQHAFITLKDHKDNFKNNPKCRLINPSKGEIGRISKAYLSNIISKLAEKIGSNQWRNTPQVINWFKNLTHKENRRLIKFDIADFYPSISEDLLSRAISYARTIITIEDKVIDAIKLARKWLLFSKDGTWVKRGKNPSFDVTMGSFDWAEICEIVGIYLLKKLSPLLGKGNFGLYRDDGLATVNSSSGPVLDRMRKDVILIFKNEGLSITIETNLIETDCLDVTFNLLTGKYFPLRKVSNKPLYINAKSNHPHAIIKELPKMINKRLSELSCNQEEFNKAKPLHKEALSESNYKASLKFEKPQYNTKRNRLRKVIWFNPPLASTLKPTLGKRF